MGAETAAPLCGGARVATINLTNGNDHFTDGSLGDTINGLGGDDYIYGQGGDDTLNGGDGIDTLDGGFGNNTLNGGPGFDHIISDGGVDTVDGGDDIDSWSGHYQTATTAITFNQTGPTSYTVSDGTTLQSIEAVALALGSGNDTINVTSISPYEEGGSTVSFDGGGGMNMLSVDLSGTSSPVSSSIGNGNEHIGFLHFRDFSHIQIKGGSDGDSVSLTGLSEVVDFDGGGGQDGAQFDFSSATAPLGLVLNSTPGSTSVISGQGSTLTNVEGVGLIAGSGNDSLTGGSAYDDFWGGPGDDVLNGGGGGDSLHGGTGANVLNGGQGDDNIFSGGGSPYFDTGELSTDTVDGGPGWNSWKANFYTTGTALTFTQTGDRSYTLSNGTTLQNIDMLDLTFGHGPNIFNLSTFSSAPTVYRQTIIGGFSNTINLTMSNIGGDISMSNAGPGTATVVDEGLYHYSFRGALEINFVSGSGNDNLASGEANDTLEGGPGNDILNGDGGVDTASYAGATSGVVVSLLLTGVQDTGGAGHDSLTNFENLTGSAFADQLTGRAAGSRLSGGGGNDLLIGGVGNDIFDGGTGVDTVSYAGASAGVHVSLLSVAAQNTVGAGTDTLTSIEKIVGSAFADTLTAGVGGSTLNGGAGGDDLIGSPGSDILNGGGASDFADYSLATAGVTVNLAAAGFQNTVGAGSDELLGIEKLEGSSFGDALTGDAGANVIYGIGGADVIAGGAGQDILSGGGGADRFVFNAASDTTVAAPDTILDFQAGDKIDLHLIDANAGVAGDQAFHLGGGGGHAGDIVVGAFVGGKTQVSLYVDANASIDAVIMLTGDHHALTAADFVL